jgi:preprotein translocase subunit SecY
VPIQHARRVVGGGKVTQGGSTFLPLKVNSAGVMPIIFAMALLALPATLGGFGGATAVGQFFGRVAIFLQPGLTWGGAMASLVYAAVIIFFTFFYTIVVMDIPQMSENLKKWNAFIPGIRPGKDTTNYLDRVISRITLAGAIFLAVIALLQFLMPAILRIPPAAFSLYGGTSILIVVGVALDTMKAIEAQLMMRHYEGFIK